MDEVTKDLRNVPCGQWKVVRIDGAIEVFLQKPTIDTIRKAISADTLDTVNLRCKGEVTGVVMLVDDTGLVDGKPVNKTASALYWAQCLPGTINPICGDVALVNDADFA